jgi:type I restriction-modification system DNA methylase subunit
MFDDSRAFVTRAFLRGALDIEYRAYGDDADADLLARLRSWSQRLQLKETSAEGAFTQTFFAETWGYGEHGRVATDHVTMIPKLKIAGEGAGGGTGEADLALGWFRDNPRAIPQVLCEFKDIRSGLDAPQARKGNTRSPVQQCLNYVRGARRGLFGNEPVQPWWGLVTDMNEFRLYWFDRPGQYLRFVIERPRTLFAGDYDLLSETEDARFDRFLFWRLFQRDQLLSPAGRPSLLRLVERQWVREKELEGEFYGRYKAVRERLFNVLTTENQDYPGSPTQLLRLSQKLLDRFIFAFYCEDMGERMLFPPQFIREYLQLRSVELHYDPDGEEIWGFFKRLFGYMDTGGKLGSMPVPHINGGLFAADPEIDDLSLPNHVFAAPGQGLNPASLDKDDSNLFYLSARYNYASRGSARESLSLYTLGRIFEQSITDLEDRANQLEKRETRRKASKRKREGVYYTPEWVVNLLVAGSLDPWFAQAKSDCGYSSDDGALPTRAQVEVYEARLRRLRIVDPACGSGAFLISAFRRLLDERIAVEREKDIAGGGAVRAGVPEAALTADILANNIYGVDINPASVEIAKLALWLHSARADAPLSSLDHTLRCGNSLIGPSFWVGRKPPEVGERERINAFDWAAAFPEVKIGQQGGGFDIVLGNPPYVDVQTLSAADPDIARWLQADRGEDTYESAQTGNFDLYLPFIEKGLRLLSPGGRMAFIAPSLWVVNKYGEGLRRMVLKGRQLDRWLDFKAFQVFEEATTYTALQFFTKAAQPYVRIGVAPQGEAADVDWANADLAVPYEAFAEDGEWLMATGAERALIDRLNASCARLDDPEVTRGIVVGIQTSADSIYHLKKLGRDRYCCSPKGGPAYEVEIEDEIMKPLISGSEAKRYEQPKTETYLLFPYEHTPAGPMRMLTEGELASRFPKALSHLRSWKNELQGREEKRTDRVIVRPFDDDAWYRFGRNQSIDKQDIPKLIVAQTVPEMRVCADANGLCYLNNVRVNGILTALGIDQLYLMGVLNGQVADFVFRRIAKPKAHGYFEANKQFIAPLPVPRASAKDQADIAERARALQNGTTERRDLISSLEDRLSVLPKTRHGLNWLWPDLPTLPDLESSAPKTLKLAGERRDWADDRLAEEVARRTEVLTAFLTGSATLEARFEDGELSLLAAGAVVLNRIYLDARPGRLAEAYWRWLLLTKTWRDGAAFAKALCQPPAANESAAAAQFIAKVNELASTTDDVSDAEAAMNEKLFDLYGLTEQERSLVGGSARGAAANHG